MQVMIRAIDPFTGLGRAARRIGRTIDRAIRRLEDRHRGELPYMRRREPEIAAPPLESLRASAGDAALPAAISALRATEKSGDAAMLKSLADDMATLTTALEALSNDGIGHALPRREPVWAGRLGERFDALAEASGAVAARQQNEHDQSGRSQAKR